MASSKRTTRRELLRLAPALALAIACKRETGEGGAPSSSSAQDKQLRIAVIPKGTTHEFWKSVHAGAVKAERELDVATIWKGPLKEDDLKQQIDLVQSFTAQAVSGIVLAPLNAKALAPSVRAAVRSGIPVVIFDSDLEASEQSSFVATDNRVAGRRGGERLLELIGSKGNVAVLRYQEGSASTHNREEGFLDALRGKADVRVVSANQYGGATTESAFAAAENVLAAHGAAKGELNGVFCPNESTTFGMLLAIKKAGLAKKPAFVGFDASEKLVQAVRSGEVDALVLQDPFRMGYLAVKTMIEKLRGGKVEARIDTGSRLLDKANVDQPEMREIYAPDLDKWLK